MLIYKLKQTEDGEAMAKEKNSQTYVGKSPKINLPCNKNHMKGLSFAAMVLGSWEEENSKEV